MKIRWWRRSRPVGNSLEGADEWTLVYTSGSAPLAEMRAEVLRAAGIPVTARQFGGGSAVIGGVPMGLRVYVPQRHVAEAREILGGDPEGEEGKK